MLQVQTKVPPGAFNLDQTAEYLGISRTTLWRIIKDGKLPVVKLRRRVVVSRAACDALLEQLAA